MPRLSPFALLVAAALPLHGAGMGGVVAKDRDGAPAADAVAVVLTPGQCTRRKPDGSGARDN